MTPDQIQQKIFYGYAKAAYKLGASFNVYRSSTPINPIVEPNLIGTIQMSASVEWKYMTASKYGNSSFNACIDAQRSSAPVNAQVGDYLIPTEGIDGFISDNHIYYVQSLQFDLPPRVVQCDRSIEIIRPAETVGPGFTGYSGYLPGTSTIIMQGMPTSILKMGKSGGAPSKLPTDTSEPVWEMLLPNLGDSNVRIGDIVIDDLEQNYVVTHNELTELGWRLNAIQVVNSSA